MTNYTDRDSFALDCENGTEDKQYYMNHVQAMTSEGLHSKSAIAGELAVRDLQIDILLAALASWTGKSGEELRADLPQYGATKADEENLTKPQPLKMYSLIKEGDYSVPYYFSSEKAMKQVAEYWSRERCFYEEQDENFIVENGVIKPVCGFDDEDQLEE